MTKGVQNKENQKKYPLLPYIITMFLVVIAIVLVSYFAQLRNNNEQLRAASRSYSLQVGDFCEEKAI